MLFSNATISLPFFPFFPRHKHMFIFELSHVNHYTALCDCTSRGFSRRKSLFRLWIDSIMQLVEWRRAKPMHRKECNYTKRRWRISCFQDSPFLVIVFSLSDCNEYLKFTCSCDEKQYSARSSASFQDNLRKLVNKVFKLIWILWNQKWHQENFKSLKALK